MDPNSINTGAFGVNYDPYSLMNQNSGPMEIENLKRGIEQ